MQPADRLARRRHPLRSSAVRDLLADAHRPGMISLAGGLPAADLFDSEVFSTLAADLLANSPQEALQYGLTAGQPRLQAAVRALVKDRGIVAPPSDPLITTGSQQAIDLLARAFIEPGDTVVMERPSYLAALQVFSLVDAEVLGVPTDEHGMCLPLPAGPALARAKLVYTVTNFANPSGVTMSRERRLALLRWAVANRVFVVEDDPYGELRFGGRPVPALVTLAAEVPGASDWCGYVSTLSKILAPGLRVGFALLPEWVRARIEQIKQAMDLHTSTLCQELAARYLETGRLTGFLERARTLYGERCEALSVSLRAQLGARVRFNRPEGGLFLWAELEPGIDTSLLLARARELGVIFVPGAAFFADSGPRNALRLSFSSADPTQLHEAVRRLRTALDAGGLTP
ncbi:MAG: PLP-dependent aminotransferase family protein [Burkholderiaceae bacterium]|nr:PLP-dependent aminotransferase family protein [Burkholderiaceae bacterium]